jgi:hypothetical protein
MNVHQLLSATPPFSSVQVQRLESGFVCVVPPGPPLAAKESGDVALAMHIFLGAKDAPSVRSSASWESFDGAAEIRYEWPPATVPHGAVFQCSKITSIRNGVLKPRGGYLVTHHVAQPGSVVQTSVFTRAAVMDRLRAWLLPATEDVEETRLISLAGMRPNPDMDVEGDDVFLAHVRHSSLVDDFNGPCPYVACSETPRLAVGVMDMDVVNYIVAELDNDMQGHFALRIHDRFLEFGPRVEQPE